MGHSPQSSNHLYIDDQNRVWIVIESVDGASRTLKTDNGEPCEATNRGDLRRVTIVRSGAILHRVIDGISPIG